MSSCTEFLCCGYNYVSKHLKWGKQRRKRAGQSAFFHCCNSWHKQDRWMNLLWKPLLLGFLSKFYLIIKLLYSIWWCLLLLSGPVKSTSLIYIALGINIVSYTLTFSLNAPLHDWSLSVLQNFNVFSDCYYSPLLGNLLVNVWPLHLNFQQAWVYNQHYLWCSSVL